ncbi:hypothetical protein [Brachybacterium paraconglomeratum]|uniref:hypothetical protein n=1 Tax=Brachybacterium paraconglomeratum TaxID=173362 RepID=UPI0022E38274|nr:hypothetical protein [Brachybacterium paraconglomeratum]
MELAVGVVGIVVAVVAVGVAVWQGRMSKEQLDLARDSEGRTQSALDEIRRLSQENRDLAAGVKSDIDTRINKFLDQQLARLEQETVSKARDDQMSSAMTEKIMGQMLSGLGFNLPNDVEGSSD